MPRRSDTYERAYDVCEDIFTELAKFPTIDLVRARIGVNSPNLIKQAINDWTIHFAESLRDRINRPDIPPTLLDAMESIWKLAINEANQCLAEDRNALDEDKKAAAAQVDKSHKAYESVKQEFDVYQTAAETERSTLKDKISQLEHAITHEKSVSAAAAKDVVQGREKTAELMGAIDALKKSHQRQLKEWESRLEKDHTWHLTRIEEEKTRAQNKADKQILEREEATNALQQQLKTIQQRLEKLKNEIAEARGAKASLMELVTALREENKEHLRTLTAAQEQLQNTQRTLKDLQKEIKATRQERDKAAAQLARLKSRESSKKKS